MTAETENLVPELLRGLRGDTAAMNKRQDGIDTRPEGWRSVFVGMPGSLVTATKHHGAPVAAREGARA